MFYECKMYHQDSGVCEIGKVILIFLKHRRRLHLRQMHPFDKIQHEYMYIWNTRAVLVIHFHKVDCVRRWFIPQEILIWRNFVLVCIINRGRTEHRGHIIQHRHILVMPSSFINTFNTKQCQHYKVTLM